MDYIIIEVPDMNDSISRVVLVGVPYQIRFSYNAAGDFWKFSLFDIQSVPIVQGIKIVPNFPLNLFCGVASLPFGVFGVMTKLDRVGRHDFTEGNAQFVFAPVAAVE